MTEEQGPREIAQPTTRRSSLPAWITPKSVPEATAIAAALAYALTYIACVQFYKGFGIEPSDVGLGYADMLAQAAVYLALGSVLLALIFGVLGVGVFIFTRSAAFWEARSNESEGPGSLKLFVVAASTVAACTIAFTMLSFAFNGANRVEDGFAIRSGIFGLLPWSDAKIASVRWADDRPGSPLPPCVIRLGEAESTEVLYDPEADATLRLPQSSVIVTIKPRFERC